MYYIQKITVDGNIIDISKDDNVFYFKKTLSGKRLILDLPRKFRKIAKVHLIETGTGNLSEVTVNDFESLCNSSHIRGIFVLDNRVCIVPVKDENDLGLFLRYKGYHELFMIKSLTPLTSYGLTFSLTSCDLTKDVFLLAKFPADINTFTLTPITVGHAVLLMFKTLFEDNFDNIIQETGIIPIEIIGDKLRMYDISNVGTGSSSVIGFYEYDITNLRAFKSLVAKYKIFYS